MGFHLLIDFFFLFCQCPQKGGEGGGTGRGMTEKGIQIGMDYSYIREV